ncbi:hypothetical protein LSH36_120g02033, partial [Paralvinella palmiformis]
GVPQKRKMAGTGVLPFVRGIDFTRNEFGQDHFPYHVSEMIGLRWLRLNQAGLDSVPYELSKLQKLEHLSLVKNNLRQIHEDITKLPNLRFLNCRHNKLKNSGVPSDIFKLQDLSVMDLSHNQLREIPSDIENTRNLLVLNLSHNEIEAISNQLFINLTDLMYIDVSHNKLETMPPQMRRLTNLQTLIISDNPMVHAQLRFVAALSSLTTLHMRNTKRTLDNFPPGLESLPHLEDNWEELEYLNISRNSLTELPGSLQRLENLRKLYMNGNQIDFNGIPASIGKLHNLEVFSAANNNLETIPEGVCRYQDLFILYFKHLQLLLQLLTLDVRGNPDLVMPPKPPELMPGSGANFYNIDFSLNHQLRLAGAMPPESPTETPSKC